MAIGHASGLSLSHALQALPYEVGAVAEPSNFVPTGILTRPCSSFSMNPFSQIRIFNYNTLERQHAYEAHSDYVRSIAVHPTQVYLDLENALLAVVC